MNKIKGTSGLRTLPEGLSSFLSKLFEMENIQYFSLFNLHVQNVEYV